MEVDLVFYVNGTKVRPERAAWEDSLVHYLRHYLHLSGTKAACGSGYCGACTVMVSSFNCVDKVISHAAMNACLLPLLALHDKAVTTVEAIGSVATSLHPVQSRLVVAHGTQCGYCSPGMVMSMYALLRTSPNPTLRQMEEALQGNMCRCTGYRPIIEGFKSFCQDCPMGAECCQNQTPLDDAATAAEVTDAAAVDKERVKVTQYDPTQEVIFPSDLQMNVDVHKEVRLTSDHVRWYQPSQLQQLLVLMDDLPNPTLLYGYTYRVDKMSPLNDDSSHRTVVSCLGVDELSSYSVDDTGVTVGPSVTISRLEEILREAITTYGQGEGYDGIYTAISEMIPTLGGRQFRNMLAIGDHVTNWSATSTLLPLLICADCDVTVASISQTNGRTIVGLRDAVQSKGLQLSSKEVIVNLKIPKSKADVFVKGYSVGPRRAMAPATIVGGLQVCLDVASNTVREACLVFGGTSDHIVCANNTAKHVLDREFNEVLCRDVIECLPMEVSGGAAVDDIERRQSLAASCFLKFFCHVRELLKPNQGGAWTSASDNTETICGTQVYEMSEHSRVSSLGQPLPHYSAPQQATGEAEFVNDIPPVEGELQLVLVWSKVANGSITSVDPSRALAMPGVVDYISSKDVPGSNLNSPFLVKDEEIFATKTVNHVGTVIGAVLADTVQHAQDAAQMVHIEYELRPPILTIQAAIEARSFYDYNKELYNGDVDRGFEAADCITEGNVSTGGQLHLPLEKGACLVIPQKGEQELEVWVTSHDATLMQRLVCSSLNLPANKVHTRVKRLGGSFGGKELTPRRYCLPTAVAAFKHKRPVRCYLTREEDALLMSSRHPMTAMYKVGYMKDATIVALDVEVYANAGSSMAESEYVMDAGLIQIDGGYRIPNLRVRGRLCKTNIISPTAFRGYGLPQTLFISSSIVRHVAKLVGLPAMQVQEKHLLIDGDYTFPGDHLVDFKLVKCWEQVLTQARYDDRKSAIKDFNRKHTWQKRGMAVEPLKCGMEIPAAFVNQGGALVNVYADGSVLLSHGGIEMGQGIHTKMIQVASRSLGIPHTKIHISETASSVVPNASATLGSMGSDYFGMAIHKACETLNKRLAPFIRANPDGRWEDWVLAAYFSRVSLSATGFHDYPGKEDFEFDKEKRKHPVFGYYTSGVACTEVELDLLTGSHVVLRTDIVMDVGKSLNPAIDIGQIEGAFVQGLGLHTSEDVKRDEDGSLLSNNYSNYFIPTIADTPREFNVTLLKESSNPRAVYSSKGVGEPPLLGASSVLFAIQDAMYAALEQHGQGDVSFILNSPATSEKIHGLCMEYGLNSL